MTQSLQSTEPTNDPMMYDKAIVKVVNTPHGSHIRALCYFLGEPGITYTFNLNMHNPSIEDIEYGLKRNFNVAAFVVVTDVEDL